MGDWDFEDDGEPYLGRRRDVAPDPERDRAAAGEGAGAGEKVH
jgi:hypothetical protein